MQARCRREAADLLQLGPKVVEHEADQRLRLLATAVRVLARGDGHCAFAAKIDRVLRAGDSDSE